MGKLFENQMLEAALHRVAEGDNSYLDYIYENYARLLFSVAVTLLGSAEAAEDAVHDTFLRLTENAAKYTPRENGSAKAWLVRICRNICIDKLREKRNSAAEITAAVDDFVHTVHSDMAFLEMISPLVSPDREIVILKIAFGMSHREIAAVLGLSAGNTRQRYKRAIDRLRKEGER